MIPSARKPFYVGFDSIRYKPACAATEARKNFEVLDTETRENHYENMPMEYTVIFHGCINDNFQLKFFFYYFHIFAQNIYCGYTLEPPH